MKVFQIKDGSCHWLTPFESVSDTEHKFPPGSYFVEAPDYVFEGWGFDDTKTGDERFIKPTAPEGYVYDDATGHYHSQEDIAQMLKEAKENKQKENCEFLNDFLDRHPVVFADGKSYGTKLEDQQEIALNITSYQLDLSAGVEAPRLEWHAVSEACVPWEFPNLVALAQAIREFVYPYYKLNQSYKEQILACTTVDEVRSIDLSYETPEEKAAREAENQRMAEESARIEAEIKAAEEAEAAAAEGETEATEG